MPIREYLYQCEACGQTEVRTEPVEPFTHENCEGDGGQPIFYRVWQAVGAIFKSQGYSRNNSLKGNKRHVG